jgi:hypothetical protein
MIYTSQYFRRHKFIVRASVTFNDLGIIHYHLIIVSIKNNRVPVKQKQLFYHSLTVEKKNMRDAGAKHMGDGKFRHPNRMSGPIYVDDGIFRHPWVVVLYYTSVCVETYQSKL